MSAVHRNVYGKYPLQDILGFDFPLDITLRIQSSIYNMTDSISAAKLAIYIVFAQPALYCLFKHGKVGFLGWFYVQTFCVLRIVTGGIGLHGSNTSTGSIILSSIGLSPLLLAASGVLHEA